MMPATEPPVKLLATLELSSFFPTEVVGDNLFGPKKIDELWWNSSENISHFYQESCLDRADGNATSVLLFDLAKAARWPDSEPSRF